MNALFLADAHLRGMDDDAQEKILRLFSRIKGRKEGSRGGAGDHDRFSLDLLVIAGDFFDFWFARGEVIYPGFRPVIDRLAELKREGVRIVLCEGNHDFFLGDYFAGRLGFEVYPHTVDLQIDGLKVLAAHGDTVDRHNRKYLALRRFLRSDFARRLQRTLPLGILWGIARLSSATSKGMSLASMDRLSGVMKRFAVDRFREGYDAVILGHAHQPQLCREKGEGREKTFAILGDWHDHDHYLLCREGHFSLESLTDRR